MVNCIELALDSNNFNYWTPIMKNDSVDGVQIITTAGESSGICKDGNNTRRITWIITCNDKIDTIEISNSSSIKASDCNITIEAKSKYGKN